MREPATVAVMDRVMRAAFGQASFADAIDRFVRAQPDGLVVETDDAGDVVGTGCCVAYPDGGFGWIGLIATAPGHERRGIATRVTGALVEVLAGHGCAAVLDASAKGRPVYERMGFVDHGATAVCLADRSQLAGAAPTGVVCGHLDRAALADVAAYDAARFGGDRTPALALGLEQRPGRGIVARRDGAVVGYTVAHDPSLAPLVADDDEALRALVATAATLPFSGPVRVSVPPDSTHLAALTALGFHVDRELRNMRLGIGALPGRRGLLAGQLSLGEG